MRRHDETLLAEAVELVERQPDPGSWRLAKQPCWTGCERGQRGVQIPPRSSSVLVEFAAQRSALEARQFRSR